MRIFNNHLWPTKQEIYIYSNSSNNTRMYIFLCVKDGWMEKYSVICQPFRVFFQLFSAYPSFFFSQFLSIFVPILTVKIMRIYTGGKGGGGEKKALVGLATIQKLPTNRHAGQMFHNYYMGYQMSDGDHHYNHPYTIGTLALFLPLFALSLHGFTHVIAT